MIRLKARYRDKKLELDQSLDLAEGSEVYVAILPVSLSPEDEDEGWRILGGSRLAEELDNPEDAIYDDWKKLYGA